jgi:hypothetical protein
MSNADTPASITCGVVVPKRFPIDGEPVNRISGDPPKEPGISGNAEFGFENGIM